MQDPTYVLQVLEVADAMKEPVGLKDFCLLLGITKPLEKHAIDSVIYYLEKRGELNRVPGEKRLWIISQFAVLARQKKRADHGVERPRKVRRSIVFGGVRYKAPRNHYILSNGESVEAADRVFQTGGLYWEKAGRFKGNIGLSASQFDAVARRLPGAKGVAAPTVY